MGASGMEVLDTGEKRLGCESNFRVPLPPPMRVPAAFSPRGRLLFLLWMVSSVIPVFYNVMEVVVQFLVFRP